VTPRLAITLGDPAGIGPEVVFAALKQQPALQATLFGSWRYSEQVARSVGFPLDFPVVSELHDIPDAPLSFVDVGEDDEVPLIMGRMDARYGAVALRSIHAAVDAIEQRLCDALVTAPVNKEAIHAAGGEFPGHTELLAARAGLTEYGSDFAMYFDSPNLRVALLTVHVSLREAIQSISATAIVALARLVDREYSRLYGSRPSIGVAGLNPHAGEAGQFGDEETVVLEGVHAAAKEGLHISGPHAADTIFMNALRGSYDVVLALYHDQGLIPVKTIAFDTSVNVTLGLPYLRASVDHGTAFDIAGKGIADAAPMSYAIRWALEHAERYRQ
jgi:4-hydroxythreonine-4-phosphate dehydrogenase